MRFHPDICPECGSPPADLLESVPGQARLAGTGGGHYYYAGDTEMLWDEQEPVTDEEGRVTLLCAEDYDHSWKAQMYPDPETAKHTGGK